MLEFFCCNRARDDRLKCLLVLIVLSTSSGTVVVVYRFFQLLWLLYLVKCDREWPHQSAYNCLVISSNHSPCMLTTFWNILYHGSRGKVGKGFACIRGKYLVMQTRTRRHTIRSNSPGEQDGATGSMLPSIFRYFSK